MGHTALAEADDAVGIPELNMTMTQSGFAAEEQYLSARLLSLLKCLLGFIPNVHARLKGNIKA